jgi:hypothetical protein
MLMVKMKKKGVVEGEGITNILIWIVFLILAGVAVYLLVKRLSG